MTEWLLSFGLGPSQINCTKSKSDYRLQTVYSIDLNQAIFHTQISKFLSRKQISIFITKTKPTNKQIQRAIIYNSTFSNHFFIILTDFLIIFFHNNITKKTEKNQTKSIIQNLSFYHLLKQQGRSTNHKSILIEKKTIQQRVMQISQKFYSEFLDGVKSYERMEYDKAIEHFVRSVEQEAQNARRQLPFTRDIGRSLNWNHSDPTPLASYSIIPPAFQPLSNLTTCLIKTHQYPSALFLCQHLITSNPYISLPYYNRASIQIRQQLYSEAINSIKCAISCEYLRKYEEVFSKDDLGKAVEFAGNNVKALGYRVAWNRQFLEMVSRGNRAKPDDHLQIEQVIEQLQSDMTQYNRYKKQHEIKFYHNQPSSSQQKQNFLISTINPHFMLESSSSSQPQQSDQQTSKNQSTLKQKLNQMKQLKQLRVLYLSLLGMESEGRQEVERLVEEVKWVVGEEKRRIVEGNSGYMGSPIYGTQQQQQLNIGNQKLFLFDCNYENTLQTSFELQDSSQSYPLQNSTNITYPPQNPTIKKTSSSILMQTSTKKPSTNPNNNPKTPSPNSSSFRSSTNKENIKCQPNPNNKRVSHMVKNPTKDMSIKMKSGKRNVSAMNLNMNVSSLARFDFTNRHINEATEEEELKTSRNKENKKKTLVKNDTGCKLCNEERCTQGQVCGQRENMCKSIISILDYEEGPSSSHFCHQNNNHQHQQNQQNYRHSLQYPSPTMIESIIIEEPTMKQSRNSMNEACYSKANRPLLGSQMTRNRSHQNLLAPPLLFPSTASNTLSLSHYQHFDLQQSTNKSLSQSKSHFKLLSCSKCSIDHANEEHSPKNVKLNINLAEVYHYNGDYTELQTYCVIKHMDQQTRTELSKGKFPNWKQPILLHVRPQKMQHLSLSRTTFSHFGDSHDDFSFNQHKIKIQLWAKSPHHKRDSFFLLNGFYGDKLIGEQCIDLREEKWVKRKIVLEDKMVEKERSMAYMYVCLEKIRKE